MTTPADDQADRPAETLGPGARIGRMALLLVIATGIVWLLFTVVFPWIERNISSPTIGT